MPKKILCIFSKKKDFEHPEKYPEIHTYFGYTKLAKDPDFETGKLEIQFEKSFFWILKNPLWLLWRPFELYFYKKTGVGFALGQILHHLRTINTHDIVYAINDTAGIPLAALKKIGLVKPKIVFVSAGLVNNLARHKNTATFRFFKWFLPAADLILAWSPIEQYAFRHLVGAKAECIPLEADVDFYRPDPRTDTDDYILSVGRDAERDTKTLIEALKALHLPAKIVTPKNAAEMKNIPQNIEMISDRIPYPQLKALYEKARIVVVPVKEAHRISGQLAFLEALAMGKAVIAARTLAFKSAYHDIVHGAHILWYEPENKEDLKEKIAELYHDREKIAKLGKNARAYAKAMPDDWFYNTLKKFLLEI